MAHTNCNLQNTPGIKHFTDPRSHYSSTVLMMMMMNTDQDLLRLQRPYKDDVWREGLTGQDVDGYNLLPFLSNGLRETDATLGLPTQTLYHIYTALSEL